ncbi:MAG: MFS transporter [Desulfobacterales bacterium]|jgi:MFS family permease|nr:MFS transporter [Desulfobacterales bacterium]MDP6471306.1 MFS transporter [Pseudomonadales bacterium]MDP6825505.1 MFS transporter [Pseudomonadales bacterium]|tara:strand:- start:1074 stop:2468 length:1395 start_codon:yes stop_codon:yes gene_type:complete
MFPVCRLIWRAAINNKKPGETHLKATRTWPAVRTGWYVTILLTIAYTFSFVDRQVLNLLVEPIRSDLGISDTEVSFLQGSAFVGAYVLMSIPIGRLVDRYHRVLILIGGVLVWSFSTVGCGFARTYMQLVLARVGVGTGEASVTPTAWSLLADYFPPERLARPMSVFLMGPYLGAGLALILGAEVIDWTRSQEQLAMPIIGELKAWQFTFIAVGLPGLLVAVVLASIREPKRIQLYADVGTSHMTWGEVWQRMLRNRRVYISLLLGAPFLVVMLYGLQAWIPTYLVRVFEWDLPQSGRSYGAIALITGSAGVLTGPYVGAWLNRRGHRDYPLRLGAIAAGLTMISMVGIAFAPIAEIALVFISLASFSVTLPLTLFSYALQRATPANMRGLIAGMYVVTVNVMGLALGPTLVALATDFLFEDVKAVGYSLALVSVVMAPIAIFLLVSGMKSYAILTSNPQEESS